MAYDLKEDDLDVVELYPEYKYTTVEELLDIFLVDPPKPVLAAFWEHNRDFGFYQNMIICYCIYDNGHVLHS